MQRLLKIAIAILTDSVIFIMMMTPALPSILMPDILIDSQGKKISNPKGWENQRRGEILRLFEDHVYGRSPQSADFSVKFRVLEEGEHDMKIVDWKRFMDFAGRHLRKPLSR